MPGKNSSFVLYSDELFVTLRLKTKTYMAQKNLHCPQCGGTNCSYYHRGYSWGGGCIGFLLLNVVGLLFGFIGYNKKICHCKDCGKRWEM